MKSLFSLLFIALSASPTMAAYTQTYTTRVPADPSLNCAQQAAAISSVLLGSMKAQLAGDATCFDSTLKEGGNTYTLRTINITYTIDESTRPYGRVYRAIYSKDISGGEPSGVEGIYDTYAACVADIPARESEYTNNTGIPAASAGCAPASLDSKYVMQIEGFGQTKSVLRFLPVSSSLNAGNNKSFLSATASVLNQVGANVSLQLDSGILYYNDNELFSQSVELNLMSNSNECETQKSTLEKLYTDNKAAHGPTSCVAFDLLGKQFYSLEGVAVGSTILDASDDMTTTYFSFDECMNAAQQANKSEDTRSAAFCKMTDRPVDGKYENPSYTLVKMMFL